MGGMITKPNGLTKEQEDVIQEIYFILCNKLDIKNDSYNKRKRAIDMLADIIKRLTN